MSLKDDVDKLNKLRKKINRIVKTDTRRAIEIAQGEYRDLLDNMLINYGKKELKKSGVKLPHWMEED